MKTTAKQVAKRLKKLGYNPLSVSEPNETEDGMVVLTDAVHVQVGYTYVNVVHENDEGFFFYPVAKDYASLAADIEKAL